MRLQKYACKLLPHLSRAYEVSINLFHSGKYPRSLERHAPAYQHIHIKYATSYLAKARIKARKHISKQTNTLINANNIFEPNL